MLETIDRVLRRLYAPGLGTAPTSRWGLVVRALRRSPTLAATDALMNSGLDLEAMLLEAATSCEDTSGDLLLTAADLRLGAVWPRAGRIAGGLADDPIEITFDAPTLPPAAWAEGDLPDRPRPTLAGIGSRAPSIEAEAFARAVGRRCAVEDVALVSGGAEGCDTAFAVGHGAAVAVLPHGLGVERTLPGAAARVSAFPRAAPFGRERAMRRNALIVAAADLTLVASVRFKEGGSWHAALGALRRRAPVAVYVGAGAGTGATALVALGALPVRDPDEAIAALRLVGELRSYESASAVWADRRGVHEERLQPTLRL